MSHLTIHKHRALVRLRGILPLESCILCLESCFLYKCRGSITSVEKALQIAPFMQNKANFQKSQMNVSSVYTKDYENIANWTLGENEPNTNPIKANQTHSPRPRCYPKKQRPPPKHPRKDRFLS